MKKILAFFLAITVVLVIARYSSADALYTRGTDGRVQTWVWTNSTAATLSTTVGTNNRILGYSFSDSAAGNFVMYDSATTGGVLLANAFAEADVIAGGNTQLMFPMPKNLSNGLVVKNSTTTGKLVVFFE